MTGGKIGGGGTVDHLEEELESCMIHNYHSIEEDVTDDENDDQNVDDEGEPKMEKKKGGSVDKQKRQQEKQKENDDEEVANDNAVVGDKQEEEKASSFWKNCPNAGKGHRETEAKKHIDHSEDTSGDGVGDEYNRNHITATFRHGSCLEDDDDGARGGGAVTKTSTWGENEISGGSDFGIDNLIGDCGNDFD